MMISQFEFIHHQPSNTILWLGYVLASIIRTVLLFVGVQLGFMTNLLNPKIAVLYVSLLPQFENPAQGSLIGQGVDLGLTQIVISFTVNLLIVLSASKIASWFGTRPTWLKVQRWLMASVLTGLAVRLAVERRQ